MSYLPPRPVKTRELKERYRQVRRRQTLSIIGFTALALLAVAALIAVLLYFSAYQRSQYPEGGGRPAKHRPAKTHLRVAGALTVDPAPVDYVLGSKELVAAQQQQPADAAYPNVAVDVLSAWELSGKGQPRWSLEQARELFKLAVSGTSAVACRAIPGEPAGLSLEGLSLENGSGRWQLTVEHADDPTLAWDEKVIVLAFKQQNSWRLIGVNAKTGAKAWVISPKFRGHRSVSESGGMGGTVSLACRPGIAWYRRDNVTGFFSSGTGKLIREYTAPGFIYQMDFNSFTQTAYLLCALKQGRSALIALPLKGGAATELYKFEGTGEQALLLAEGSYVALGFVPRAEKDVTARVVCFRSGETEPAVSSGFAEGALSDIALLPDSAGEFLVAVNDSAGGKQGPSGGSELWRLRLTDGTPIKVQRLARPVRVLETYKDACLVLLQGGEILSVTAAANKTRRLARADYSNLEPLNDFSYSRLAIASYPDESADGKPGRMQFIFIQ